MKKLLAVLFVLMMLVGCSAANGEETSTKKSVGVIQLVQHEALDKATQGFVDVLKEEFGDDIKIEIENASGDSATCST